MEIHPKFNLGQKVYHSLLEIDERPLRGIVSGYMIPHETVVEYNVIWENMEQGMHKELELITSNDIHDLL